MTPYYADDWLTIYLGDCRAVLAELPDESVHCVVTSPPYWGLRDYGTATWEGSRWECGGRHEPMKGDPDWWRKSTDEIRAEIEAERLPDPMRCPICGAPPCDHKGPPQATRTHVNRNTGNGETDDKNADAYRPFLAVCGKCGARRIDAQLGLEPTPEEYVANLVAVFREVRRVLRRDGTLWLNLGDSYANDGKWGGSSGGKHVEALHGKTGIGRQKVTTGLKPKDLVGIPWRVAFALQADGWWLRSDIIWAKPNPMPESVTDRPTKSHEYLFLLSKSARYYYDAEAVREDGSPAYADGWPVARAKVTVDGRLAREAATGLHRNGTSHAGLAGPKTASGRNLRSVWTIATQPYPGAHFATFPRKLVEPCVKAGTSERGVCPECGAPWDRVVERIPAIVKAPSSEYGHGAGRNDGGRSALVGAGATTTGWRPTCAHTAEPAPAVVLDPFGGSGTTGMVAQSLSRRAVLIDLNGDYLVQAMERNRDIPLGLDVA